jgi:hypothetical protein
MPAPWSGDNIILARRQNAAGKPRLHKGDSWWKLAKTIFIKQISRTSLLA